MNYQLSFAQDLAVLLRTGMPLSKAIELQSEHHPNQGFKACIKGIHNTVLEGEKLSHALTQHPQHFGPYFIGVVKSGEVSAELPQALTRLADQLDRDQTLKKQVTSSLIYPAILIAVMFLSLLVIFAVVVPQFSQLFENYSENLNLSTKVILGIGNFIEHWGRWILVFSTLALIALWHSLWRSAKRNGALDLTPWLLSNTPYIRDLYTQIDFARFNHSLSSLLDSGLGQVDALRIAGHSFTTDANRAQIDAVIIKLEEGQTLGACFPELKGINPLYAHSLFNAEAAGELPTALKQIAHRMESSVNDSTKRLAQIVEPALVIVIGSVVGVIVYALFSSLQNLGNFSI